jgi:hypothetical protein
MVITDDLDGHADAETGRFRCRCASRAVRAAAASGLDGRDDPFHQCANQPIIRDRPDWLVARWQASRRTAAPAIAVSQVEA